MRAWAVGLCLGCLPVAANAVENWTVLDLGTSRKAAFCMASAEAAFVEYAHKYAIRRVARSDWIIFAWGIGDRGDDGMILCTDGPGGGTQATIVLYAENSALSRIEAERIGEKFVIENRERTKRYIEEALRENGF